MKLRGKIVSRNVILFVLGFIIFLIVILYSITNYIVETNSEKLLVSTDLKKQYFESFFQNIEHDLNVIASRPNLTNDFNLLLFQFDNINKRHSSAKEHLQNLYILNNPYETKNELNSLLEIENYNNLESYSIVREYGSQYEKIHPEFNTLLVEKGYDDILFISTKGDIIYSTSKNSDFAANVVKDLDHTNLYQFFELLSNSEEVNVQFVDFEIYEPTGRPQAFAGKTILNPFGYPMGYLIFEISIDQIDSIMQDTTGMSDYTQTYVVGKDLLMRNNSIYAEYPTILSQKVETPQVFEALNGEKGWIRSKDYSGEEVLAVYEPFTYNNINWAMIGETKYSFIQEQIDSFSNLIIIIFAAITIAVVISSILFSNATVKPIKALTHKIQIFSRGDLSVDFQSDKNDEIGEMSKALSEMSSTLKNSIENIINSSNKVQNLSLDLRKFSTNLTESSNSLTEKTQVINNETQETAASIEEVTAGVQEVTSTTSRVEEDMNILSGESQKLSIDAQEGRKEINEIAQNINNSLGKTENTSEIVKSLAKSAQDIEDIVETISSITEQTNLLALNAAIEAARAGEAGRGFSVVADEIRALAEQSKDATQRISEILKNIKEQSKSANESIDITYSTVKDTFERSSSILEHFNMILDRIQNISNNINNIKESVEQQTEVTNEIAVAMDKASNSVSNISEKINTIFLEVKSQNEQTIGLNDNIKELSTLSTELKNQFQQFTL